MKFTEECVMYTEKHVLVKKIFTKRLHMGFVQQAGVKKTVHRVKTH